MRGVFCKFVSLEILFRIIEKIAEVDKKYLGVTFQNEPIHYEEKPSKLKIKDLLNYLDEDKKEISLDIEVDYESLGVELGKKIVCKINDSDIKIHKMTIIDRNIILIKYIFESVSFLQGKFMNIYGSTFNSVKGYIFSVYSNV